MCEGVVAGDSLKQQQPVGNRMFPVEEEHHHRLAIKWRLIGKDDFTAKNSSLNQNLLLVRIFFLYIS